MTLRQTILAHYVLNFWAAITPNDLERRAILSARFDLPTDFETLKEQPLDETWAKYQALYRHIQQTGEPLDDEIPWL